MNGDRVKTCLPALAAAAFLAFPVAAFCQQTGCDLQVTCAPGVRIFVNRTFRGVASEQYNGLFIKGLAPGQYTVEAVRDGYQKHVYTVIIGPEDSIKQLDIPDQWVPAPPPREQGAPPAQGPAPAAQQTGGILKKFQFGIMLDGSVATGDELFDGNGPLGGGVFFRFKPSMYFDIGVQFGLLATCFRADAVVEESYLPESDPNHQEMTIDIRDGMGFLMSLSVRGMLPAAGSVDLFACFNIGYIVGLGVGASHDSYNDFFADVDDTRYNGGLRLGSSLGIEFKLGRTFTIGFEFGIALQWQSFEIEYDNGKNIAGTYAVSEDALLLNARLFFGFRI